MSDERIPKCKLDLNLYLGLPQEQQPDNVQSQLVRHQQQDQVEVQVSRSSLQHNIQLSLASPHRMTSPIQSYDNYQYSEQGQFLPSQAVKVETIITEPSHRGRKRFRCVDNVKIQPPYPWATNRPATIKSRRDLSLENINMITGQVKCKSCVTEQTLEYNLEEKFSELCQFIVKEKEQMRRQSPKSWMHPKLPLCMTCNSEMKPDICTDKKKINWLFLLLGQMLGCCNLEDLKFFCKWNTQHCTGSKDRVLYLTYLALCRQLEPNGPFDP